MTGRHTAPNLKKQYDLIMERFSIQDKIFKVVADQAANVKKSFENYFESTKIVGGACEENIVKITNLLLDRRRQLDLNEAKKQAEAVIEINNEIENANASNSDSSKISSFFKRDQILAEMDDITEEMSESEDEDGEEEQDKTKEDADDDLENIEEVIDQVLSYLPCGAHNIQLVVKDGLKLDDNYSKLLTKVSSDIVSRSKVSHLIAEEVRRLDKSLYKAVVTRWNSILFMIRSVLKLTATDFASIRKEMSTKTARQKEIKKNFNLTSIERDMLLELKIVLEMFEFATNELQCNNLNYYFKQNIN